MAKLIVLLSGHVASGKSTLASRLENQFGFYVVKTWQLLKAVRPEVSDDRQVLQELGEELDRRTGGEWLLEELDKEIRSKHDNDLIVVDAVRMLGQIESVRRGFGRNVKHIHLDAPLQTLANRYDKRKAASIQELGSYEEVLKNQTEQSVSNLAQSADIVVDTARNTEMDVLTRAGCHLGLYGRGYERVVDVLVGGQFGSEGKGQVAAYLAPEYDLLIRVGGPNAGHKVYEDPEPYTFHSLPSGTRASNARILIGAGAVINVETLWREINDCDLDHRRLTIDPQVLVISAEDIEKERALKKSIGSTGQGVGAATARRILDRGIKGVEFAKDVDRLKPFVRPTHEVIEDACRQRVKILLEGTQGTGLSLYHGSYPHVTSRETTVAGCLAEAGISPSRVRKVLMVCRTYPIRVQDPDKEGNTSGPMSQPISWREISRRSGISEYELNKTEKTSTTNRKRRVSEFDWVLLKKAAELNAPTDIALTFADYLSKSNREARRLEQLTAETVQFIQEVERVAEAPVSLISTRFHHRSIIDRRTW